MVMDSGGWVTACGPFSTNGGISKGVPTGGIRTAVATRFRSLQIVDDRQMTNEGYALSLVAMLTV